MLFEERQRGWAQPNPPGVAGRGDLEWTNKATLAPRRMEGGLAVRRVEIANAI
jgi:hypothetical protein